MLYEFVKKWEWEFQSHAFCDSYYSEKEKIKYWITSTWLIRKSPADCTYWSIWYWTKSYRGEVITHQEAIERKVADLERRKAVMFWENWGKCLTNEQKIVILDFAYQHWVNSSGMKQKIAHCNIKDIYYTLVNWRDHYRKTGKWWMVKREQMRINYFYNN